MISSGSREASSRRPAGQGPLEERRGGRQAEVLIVLVDVRVVLSGRFVIRIDRVDRAHRGHRRCGRFCPDCGAANLAVHFNREVELIGRQLDLAESVEDREMGWRLLGNAHEDVLTALETYLKVVYRFVVIQRHSGEERDHFLNLGDDNVFQSKERAAERFSDLEIELLRDLDESERRLLDVYVHTRHVIGHNLGLVDRRFTERTERGEEGETVPLVVEDVRRFAAVAKHIVAGLEDVIPELSEQ